MLIYRTAPYDDNYLTYLNKLWEDNWIFSGQLWDKLVFRKEDKRIVSKKEIVEDDRFQEFYWVYPNKKNRQWAVKEWYKLSEEDKTQAIQTVSIYKKWCEHKYTENGKLIKDKILHPDTYLRNKRWNDEIEIDWKSKSNIIKEKEMIEKRRKEESYRHIQEEKEREKAEDVTIVISRLKEQGLYWNVLEEARASLPDNSMQYAIDIKARMLVSQKIEHYKNLLTFE